jgi:lipopolysaccharide/colanic/teichoic acid biosynthesis glycosyltransferase
MNALELEVKRDKIRFNYFLKNHPRQSVAIDHPEDLESVEITQRDTLSFNHHMNHLVDINGFLREVNHRMEVGSTFKGTFVDCRVRSSQNRTFTIPVIGKICKVVDFSIHRVVPKTKGLRKLYFAITKGKNRRISKAEMLGRLIYCGFEIQRTEVINGVSHFEVRKNGDPLKVSSVSEGWIYRMPRVGLKGKTIHVYKFRTMHPYSEFLQDHLKNTNGYGPNGKISDDYRLTTWGKFLRKYWLDELPQLINVIKGDMKIVGVRPISNSYFRDIPQDLQNLRLQHKPGCIPPYVAMNRASSVSSVLTAEKEYMEVSLKKPYTTDIKYLFWAIYNIIVKKKRSA